MLRLIARRLALSVALVFVVTAVTFVLESLTPGDAARTILGTQFTPARYAQLRHQLGLDVPLPAQYWHWVRGLVAHGSLGSSVTSGQAVTTILDQRLGVTVALIVGATVLSSALGIGLGVLGALRGGVIGRLVDVLTLVGMALPSFWLGLVLVALFAVEIPLFPATGYVPWSTSPFEWVQSLTLPVVTLAVAAVAMIAKQTRDSMLDVLGREFVWALRARGVPERTVIFRHALRAAAIPIVTVIGLVFVGLLSGTVLVENVFALPGLGTVAVQATTNHDLLVVLGVALYFTVIVVIVNLLLDLIYGWLNPKVRTS
jgi:peptide/nickel transport system permease protein